MLEQGHQDPRHLRELEVGLESSKGRLQGLLWPLEEEGLEELAAEECGDSTQTTPPESRLDPSQCWSCPCCSSPASSCFTSGENTTGPRASSRRSTYRFVINAPRSQLGTGGFKNFVFVNTYFYYDIIYM